MNIPLIHVICDYGPGDLAFTEIEAALTGWDEHYRGANAPAIFTSSSVHSFNTVETGFVVGQLALQTSPIRPRNLTVYANCAPRQDREDARLNNEGENFLYAVLTNGTQIVAVNAGFSLSFVRDPIRELWHVNVDRGGSQFRSRDNFPAIVIQVARGMLDGLLVDRLDPVQNIPAIPEGVVGYRDSFGNLKTTFRANHPILSKLTPGQRFDVEINGTTRKVRAATGSFSVDEGDIAFSLGSSGHDNRFWEIFQRGGDAWRTYGKPSVGARIALRIE